MARYTCQRCQTQLNTLDDPHICKDIFARMRRRERQVMAVLDVFDGGGLLDGYTATAKRSLAEEIVKALSNLGVTDD
jgi:hypothetical protein